jgi:hypothetical protein
MGGDRVPAPEAVPEGVAFEVERFEWTHDHRLELAGRWYGLRGHRFVRPALTVDAGDDRRRILADLEHKPWAAQDGEEWIAAFPWEGAPVDLAGAELAVAPSLAVQLPPPRGPGRRRKAPLPRPDPTPEAPVPADPATVRHLEAELADAQAAIRRLTAELDEPRARAASERGEALERAEREREAALAQRDRAVDARAALLRQRDASRAARDRAAAPVDELASPTAPSPRRPGTGREDARRTSALALWGQRFAALVALMALAAVVYTLLHNVV